MKNYYLIAGPEVFSLETTDVIELAGHKIARHGGHSLVWPQNIDSTSINPANIYEIKENLKTDSLIVVDRLLGVDKLVSIGGHINKSGTNFLMGNTPFKTYPRFPDLGGIYESAPGEEAVVVQTIGPDRFQNSAPPGDVVLSEGIALVSTVLHYLQIRTTGVGLPASSPVLLADYLSR